MDLHRISHEAARLLPLAQRVLEHYPFRVREVAHLATHSNVMYRVVTSDGFQCVLRVGSPGANSRANIDYEVAWLAALNNDTDLEIVTPIKTGYGTMVVDAKEPGSAQTRPCVLFSWIPGAPLADGAGSFGYRLLGRVSASLQGHGRTWQVANADRMRRWDRIFYYDPEFDPVVIESPRFDHLFDSYRRRIISDASELCDRVIEDAWATGPVHVVHGDLHEWNVHLVGSRLHAFDFEDVMIATPGQDVSVCLYSSRASERRGEIRVAYRQGYEEIAPWPIEDVEQLDGFHAARQIMLMNHAARTLPMGEAEEYLTQVMPWLRSYVDQYG
jgi:Ser/Thr protein kinase RdoA (MazF antagonist)